MRSDSTVPNRIVLNSWKEIASYVGRGVRTVQRWERDLGMPVRRPRAKSRSAVLGMSDEIDAWLRSAPTGELKPATNKPDLKILEEFRRAVAEHSGLRAQCERLQLEHRLRLSALVSNLQSLMTSVEAGRASHALTSHLTSLSADDATVHPTAEALFND